LLRFASLSLVLFFSTTLSLVSPDRRNFTVPAWLPTLFVASYCDSGDDDEGFREDSQRHSLRNRSAAAGYGLLLQTFSIWFACEFLFSISVANCVPFLNCLESFPSFLEPWNLRLIRVWCFAYLNSNLIWMAIWIYFVTWELIPAGLGFGSDDWYNLIFNNFWLQVRC